MKYPETLTDATLEIIFNCVEACYSVYESSSSFQTIHPFVEYDYCWFTRGLGESLVVVLTTPTSIYVVFRGTVIDSISQVKSDINANWIVEPNIGYVSTGVRQEVDCIWHEVFKKLTELLTTKLRFVYVTGHSLGGGMASLLTARLVLHAFRYNEPFYIPAGLVTFGALRVGDHNFTKHVETINLMSVKDRQRIGIWRFKNGTDFIPQFPPKFWGYQSEGSLVYISPDGSFHIDPWSFKRLWWEFKGSCFWFRMLSRGLYDHRISQYKKKIGDLVITRTKENEGYQL